MAADNYPTSLVLQHHREQLQDGSPAEVGNDDEATMLEAARRRRADELASVDAEIAQLETKRAKLRIDLKALDILLGEGTTLDYLARPETVITGTDNLPQVGHRGQVRLHQPSEELSKSITAVVEVLEECGELHYRDIYTKVAARSITIPGKDPAATLLSRFSRDPRVERVSAGTYRLIPDVVPNAAN